MHIYIMNSLQWGNWTLITRGQRLLWHPSWATSHMHHHSCSKERSKLLTPQGGMWETACFCTQLHKITKQKDDTSWIYRKMWLGVYFPSPQITRHYSMQTVKASTRYWNQTWEDVWSCHLKGRPEKSPVVLSLPSKILTEPGFLGSSVRGQHQY